MRTWLLLTVAACGAKTGDTSEAVDTAETSSTDPATTTSKTTTNATTELETTTSSVTAADSRTSTDDAAPTETCVRGTFVGLVTAGFESSAFESCETGESWWFVSGANGSCPSALWVRVEGELCGPGSYGHLGGADYELRGEVVEGPCEAACEGEPEPSSCASFPELCPLVECLLVAQDCETGQRCVPTVLDNGPPWHGATCVRASDPAQTIGETCTSAGPWQDDCEPAAYCVADALGVGICAAICDPEDTGACGDETCWPCDFTEPPVLVGVCGSTRVAC